MWLLNFLKPFVAHRTFLLKSELDHRHAEDSTSYHQAEVFKQVPKVDSSGYFSRKSKVASTLQ